MRFRLVHLILATAIVAIGLMVADRYLNQTVLVEFKTLAIPRDPARLFNESGYRLRFTIHYAQYPVEGWIHDSFGFSSIFNFDVDTKSIAMLDGRKLYLRHRKRSLPWLPATRIEDQLKPNFDTLLVFPNADEWRAIANRR